MALERRLSQLDASSNRREGILAPFIPDNDRPWRNRMQDQPDDHVGQSDALQEDLTADMSMHWELETNEEAIDELKQELVGSSSAACSSLLCSVNVKEVDQVLPHPPAVNI